MSKSVKVGVVERRRNYTWYICPLDGWTNQVISREIREENAYSEIEVSVQGVCIKKKLWECDFDTLMRVRSSKKRLNLRFKIWVKEGGGIIRPAPPWMKS